MTLFATVIEARRRGGRAADSTLPPRTKEGRDRKKYNAYLRDYMRARYEQRRARGLEMLGGKCIDCGGAEGLQFDHADRTSKRMDIAKRIHGAPWSEVLVELAKCVLRCAPCHEAKTILERGRTVRSPRLLAHLERIGRSV